MAMDLKVVEEIRRNRSTIVHTLEQNPEGMTPMQVSRSTGIPLNRAQNYLRQIVRDNTNVTSKSVVREDGRKESIYTIKKV